MDFIKEFKKKHPDMWEFIIFNVLSNCATITNFVVMFIASNFLFARFKNQPFKFFLFDYTSVESLMLCGFLSFLLATSLAQAVNFYVQKNFVFKSNADFKVAISRYIILVLVLIILSLILPAYSMRFFESIGISRTLSPSLAVIANIVMQVIISYPSMKYFVLPKKK